VLLISFWKYAPVTAPAVLLEQIGVKFDSTPLTLTLSKLATAVFNGPAVTVVPTHAPVLEFQLDKLTIKAAPVLLLLNTFHGNTHTNALPEASLTTLYYVLATANAVFDGNFVGFL
jgi:hypothetical protein